MTRDEILAKLRALKPWLKEQGIVRVRLFGSYARDEARPGSDIDLLVDFATTPDLWTFAGIREELSRRLGADVDIVTERAVHDRLRSRVLAAAVDA